MLALALQLDLAGAVARSAPEKAFLEQAGEPGHHGTRCAPPQFRFPVADQRTGWLSLA